MSENLYEVLETCLREMEDGTDLETVLARRPQAAGDLRPILLASASARRMAGGDPSPEVVRRARAKVMQKASEMRETGFAPRGRSIPALRRLLISFALAFLLLLSGSGLLRVSASALPGERLYPVKRGWENVRLIFVLDPGARAVLESRFYYERLSEVIRLLAQGRVAPVEFAGIYVKADGLVYVSGIQIIILDSTALPAEGLQNGDAVLVFGTTTPNSTVQANAIHLLPNPSVVPPGDPTPTAQAKPSATPLPAFKSTPTVQPTISVPQPTSAKPSINNGNHNSNRNDNDDNGKGNNNNNNNDNDNDNDNDDNDNDGDDD